MKIGRLVLLTEFIVSDQVDEILFGMDWLNQNKCVLECGSNTLRIQDSFFELFKKVPKECRHRIVSKIDVHIPARTEALISGKAVYSNLSVPNADLWSTSPNECVQGLHAARGLVRLRSGWDIPVRVVNLNNVPVVVKKDTYLSSMSEVHSVAGGPEEGKDGADFVRTGLLRQHVTDMSSKVHPEVSHSQRLHLEHLLFQYSDILSCSEMDLGHTDLVQHSIDTGDEKPVRQQLRKTPLAHGQIIDDNVENLLRHGLIQPAREDWASNIVLTAKKDRSRRFCIDYRQLNSKTKRDLFPLPRIDACLDALSQAVWFSTLDFRSGYYQVGLRPEDARKTTFISRKGAWSWKVMPMGLSNAAATFQRLMNLILSGLTYETCLVYLDDIIVYAPTLEAHMARLEAVFERIRQARLKLRPDKCHLLQKEVKFLGHVISAHGISMDPGKLDSVRSWPTPTKLRDVRAFVGLCSYYRRHIRDFSAIAQPLHALTKKNTRFYWSSECEESFRTLKEALTSAPIIALPRDEGTSTLDTDASRNAIGAVLSQTQDGEERVVAYGSRLCSRAEANYCTTRQELHAVVFFVEQFKQYLLGRPFVIRTDHAALKWLHRTPEPVGQQSRWLEQLAAYDFQIVHRPGVKHANADALSRIPCHQCGWEEDSRSDEAVVTAVEEPVVDTWSPIQLAQMQANDAQFKQFFTWKMTYLDAKPEWSEVATASDESRQLWAQWDDVVFVNGVLYRQTCDEAGSPGVLQLLLPLQLREEFLSSIHTGMTGGTSGLLVLGLRFGVGPSGRDGPRIWIGLSNPVFHVLATNEVSLPVRVHCVPYSLAHPSRFSASISRAHTPGVRMGTFIFSRSWITSRSLRLRTPCVTRRPQPSQRFSWTTCSRLSDFLEKFSRTKVQTSSRFCSGNYVEFCRSTRHAHRRITLAGTGC